MYYVAHLMQKKKLFQKPYIIKDRDIYITDTKHGKKKFLKTGIKNVVFGEEFASDEIFAPLLCRMYAYDEAFVEKFIHSMLVHMTRFLKMDIPVEEICIFTPGHEAIACSFAKMVTVVGEGEDKTVDGISIRYVKKVRSLPSLAIACSNEQADLLWGVPCINICEKAKKGKNITTWETMSFKCSLFPFEISAATLIYLLKTTDNIAYEITSLRKKSPTLLTFC